MIKLFKLTVSKVKNEGLIKTFISILKFIGLKSKKINLDKIKLKKFLNLDELFLRFGTDKGFLDGKKTFYILSKKKNLRKIFRNYEEWILRENLYDYDYEVGHNYTPTYEKYFEKIKDKNLNILEIGVAGGHSIASWYKYFVNSKIYGIDIREPNTVLYEGKRFEYHKIDCTDITQVNYFKNKKIKFDVIIDDSLHDYDGFIGNIKNFFPLLNEGGIFFLEDFKPKDERLIKVREYNKKVKRNIVFGSNQTMHEIFNNLNNKVFFENLYISKDEQKYLHDNVKNIEIVYNDHPFSSIAIIEKN